MFPQNPCSGTPHREFQKRRPCPSSAFRLLSLVPLTSSSPESWSLGSLSQICCSTHQQLPQPKSCPFRAKSHSPRVSQTSSPSQILLLQPEPRVWKPRLGLKNGSAHTFAQPSSWPPLGHLIPRVCLPLPLLAKGLKGFQKVHDASGGARREARHSPCLEPNPLNFQALPDVEEPPQGL